MQDGDVDGITSPDGIRKGLERTGGGVRDGDADAEDVRLVLGREIHVVTTVPALDDIVVPKLAACPGNVLDIQDVAPVLDRGGHGVAALDGEDVVVLHVILAAEVVVRCGGFPVMGGIDVHLAVEHVDGRVGHIVLRKEVALGNFVFHNSL